MTRFRKLGPFMNEYSDQLPQEIWPITKVWKNEV